MDPFAPGAHYKRQFRAKEEGAALDVFAVLGLPADNPGLTQRGARQHYRKQVAKHVFEHGDATPPTAGPFVPLWIHVNVAKNMLLDRAALAEFEYYKLVWQDYSRKF